MLYQVKSTCKSSKTYFYLLATIDLTSDPQKITARNNGYTFKFPFQNFILKCLELFTVPWLLNNLTSSRRKRVSGFQVNEKGTLEIFINPSDFYIVFKLYSEDIVKFNNPFF